MAPPPLADSLAAARVVPDLPSLSRQSWLSGHLRNIVILALTVSILYLAYIGVEQARTALITAFTLLAGSVFGERAALKKPGTDL